MKCFHVGCHRSAPQYTLFRVNQKGVPGIWACEEHRIETDRELDEIINEILKEQDGRTTK